MKVRLQRNSKRRSTIRVVLIALFVVLVGMLLPKAFSVVTAVVSYPVHVTNNWLNESSSLVPVFVRSRLSLESQIEQLEEELVVERRADITQQRLQEENAQLRQLLGVTESGRIGAAVIGRPDSLPYDLLQIDQGGSAGITVGAPVFVGSDIVIGLVVHVTANYSFVELFTTPGFKATAFIAGPNVVAHIEGVGGGVARVRVPQGIPLSVGNLVHLPSIDPGVFGRVSHVENEPTQPEQYGYIAPDISIHSIHRVSVGQVSQISQSVEVIDERVRESVRTQLVVPGLSTDVTASSSVSTTTASSTL